MRDGPVWTIEPPIDTDADHLELRRAAFQFRRVYQRKAAGNSGSVRDGPARGA